MLTAGGSRVWWVQRSVQTKRNAMNAYDPKQPNGPPHTCKCLDIKLNDIFT